MRFVQKKIRFIVGLLAFAMLVGCSSKKAEIQDKQAMLYFSAGTQSLMTANYTDALKNLLQANEMAPDNADIITNLGMAYYFKGESVLAIKHLNRALELNPDQTDAKLNLASIHYKEGNINEAERIYKNVLQDLTYDKQARTYYNLALLESDKRKNYAAAEDYLKQALKEDENYCPAFHQLGLIQFRTKRYNTAEKTFFDGTRGVCLEFAANYYYHALTLIQLNRLEDARLRLDEIDVKFKDSKFAQLAHQKLKEISRMGASTHSAPDTHASRKHLESPEF